MKKLFLLGLVAALLVSTAALPPSANAQGAGLVSSILNKMERNRRDMRSLRAGVLMQKYNAQIKVYDNFQGDVQYVPGAGQDVSVRIDWQKPQREHLAVTGGKYTLFKPLMNMAYQGSTNSASKNNKINSVLGFGMNMSKAQFNSNYSVELIGEGTLDGPHVWLLKFTPKGNAGFKFAEVWVDDSGMALQTRVTERNNDSTLVRLLNPQKNVRIDPESFKLPLAPGVKIVKG
jgi:outer membrane lipoprotein-sorting protein